MWLETGSLYSPFSNERLREGILDDLEREIAPMREVDAERFRDSGYWFDPTRNDTAVPASNDLNRELAEADFVKHVRDAYRRSLDVHKALGVYARNEAAS